MPGQSRQIRNDRRAWPIGVNVRADQAVLARQSEGSDSSSGSDERRVRDGRLVTPAEWDEHADEWIPNERDRGHVRSLMTAVHEPGRMASWIAPPASGIHQQPIEFEYVRP